MADVKCSKQGPHLTGIRQKSGIRKILYKLQIRYMEKGGREGEEGREKEMRDDR